MCAFMRGAAQVFIVDAIRERLDKAGELGAQPIDMREGDTVDRILEQMARERSGVAWRGEEANLGATVCIDADRLSSARPTRLLVERPRTVIEDLARIIAPNGRLGHHRRLPRQRSACCERGCATRRVSIPWGTLFKKGVMIGMGRDDDKRYNDHLS